MLETLRRGIRGKEAIIKEQSKSNGVLTLRKVHSFLSKYNEQRFFLRSSSSGTFSTWHSVFNYLGHIKSADGFICKIERNMLNFH